MTIPFTLKSQMLRSGGHYTFKFYCDRCEAGSGCPHGYVTAAIEAASIKDAYAEAQQEARLHFNFCTCCQRWVCDDHFDVDTAQCTDCLLGQTLKTG